MEKNNAMDANQWLEERLATLTPDSAWQPNFTKALAQLRARRSKQSVRGRWCAWAATATVAGSLCMLALPGPRVFAYRCLDCSVTFWQGVSTAALVQARVKPEKGRKMAPDFSLVDGSGNAVKLSEFKGKVVLLNFWATWCGGCKVDIPWFDEFENKYKDSGFAVIGVSMDADGWKSVTPFVAKKKMNYRVVIGNDDLAKLYGVTAMPETLLIDPDGKIAAWHLGAVSKSDYKTEIERLLSQKGNKF